jgi:hypothetical protein
LFCFRVNCGHCTVTGRQRIDKKAGDGEPKTCDEGTVIVLDNLTLLALLIIAVWLATLAYYFYTSRQHKLIEKELEEVRALLDEEETR